MKRNNTLRTLAMLTAIGGATALGIKVYRHPHETMDGLLHTGMRLVGAREGTCDIGNFPMHYYCAGRRGTPIVLVHGLGSSALIWIALLPLLSKEYLVYAPDMPGFGITPLAPEGVNIRTHALYLERFLDALGYPCVTLVGNSMGGWTAARFAINHPERVNHLYLLNSAGLTRENMLSPYATDRNSAQRTLNALSGFSLPMPGFVLDSRVRASQVPSYKNFIEKYEAHEELDTVLAHIKVPTTIIWGERDGIFPVTCANDFHAGIVDSELFLLPGVGHMPQIQAPAKVARIIRETRLASHRQ